ncbi:hypothetical protein L6R50_10085 [Myxococcota bacterium]|nr:hypothetical protein [Myxococcota bacterium]
MTHRTPRPSCLLDARLAAVVLGIAGAGTPGAVDAGDPGFGDPAGAAVVRADGDGDGSLSPTEAAGGRLVSDDEAGREAFADADADGDGRLTSTELRAHYRRLRLRRLFADELRAAREPPPPAEDPRLEPADADGAPGAGPEDEAAGAIELDLGIEIGPEEESGPAAGRQTSRPPPPGESGLRASADQP